jgi:hypothetical protein
MPEESPDLREEVASIAMLRDQRRFNRKLRWYQRLLCLMPTMIGISLVTMIELFSKMYRAHFFLTALVGIERSLWIVIGIATFILGLVSSRLDDALYHQNCPKRFGQMCWYAIKFSLLQLLIMPLFLIVIILPIALLMALFVA